MNVTKDCSTFFVRESSWIRGWGSKESWLKASNEQFQVQIEIGRVYKVSKIYIIHEETQRNKTRSSWPSYSRTKQEREGTRQLAAASFYMRGAKNYRDNRLRIPRVVERNCESWLKASNERFRIQIDRLEEFAKLPRYIKFMKKLNRIKLEAPDHRTWRTNKNGEGTGHLAVASFFLTSAKNYRDNRQ